MKDSSGKKNVPCALDCRSFFEHFDTMPRLLHQVQYTKRVT